MKRLGVLLTTAAGILLVPAVQAGPSLAVQDVSQDSETAAVTVSYKLTGAAAVVTVDIQTNAGGSVWVSIGGERQRHWAGDVNRLVAADADTVRTARWIADEDWPGFVLDDSKVRAVVKAWPQDDPPDYMVVDSSAPSNVNYYATADALPQGVTDRLYKTERFVLRRIHAADVVWMMGSPSAEPGRASNEWLHPVKLTADYYMGVYPVTQFQWQRQTGKNISKYKTGTDSLLHPVENVTWSDLRGGDWIADGHDGLPDGKFMSKLRKLTGVKFDLPTSAQWEYACRAGTMTSLYSGVSPTYTAPNTWSDYSDETDALAWNYHNNADDPDCVVDAEGYTTHIVGKKPANPWGLYDMLGNTWDICLDWYDPNVSGSTEIQVDPVGPSRTDYQHVWRGGDSCANMRGSYLRAARIFSRADNYDDCYSSVGFRLACPAVAVGSYVNEGGAQ